MLFNIISKGNLFESLNSFRKFWLSAHSVQSPEGCWCGILAPSCVRQGCPAVSDGHPEVGGTRLHGIQHHRRIVLAAPLEFPGSTRALAPQVVTANLHSGFLQVTPSQGPCTRTPCTPSGSAGLWALGPGQQGHMDTAPGGPWDASTVLLLPVGKRRHRTVRELPRVPRLRPECPDRCDPVFPIHTHGCIPLSSCYSAGAVLRWPAGPAQVVATKGEAVKGRQPVS